MHQPLGKAFARKARLVLLGTLALAAGESLANAQDLEIWRCNTPSGTLSTRSIQVSDKNASFSGRVNFHKASFGPRWGSIARITFQDSGEVGGACGCNGLLIKAFEESNWIEFYLLVEGREVAVLSARNLETTITFSVSIDPRGIMTARIGKDHVDIKSVPLIHTAHDKIGMFCSGADVSFLNITAD